MNKLIRLTQIYRTKQIISNIYIHLPFCIKKCHFCAFPVHAVGQDTSLLQRYLVTLKKQIKIWKQLNDQIVLCSLYIGGGTPSLYNHREIQQLIGMFKVDNRTQITMQLNANQIQKLYQFNNNIINRISIGIQSFNIQLLKQMNRIPVQNKYDIQNILKNSKIRNINVDFILNFCLQQPYFKQMIDFIKQVNPQHITIYLLQINQGSYIHQKTQKYSNLLNDQLLSEKYKYVSKILTDIGNFAKSSQYQSLHNAVYWSGNKQFQAFGMGATSLINQRRITKPKSILNYQKYVQYVQKNINDTGNVDYQKLKLNIQMQNEMKQKIQILFLSGLRTKKGIHWKQIQQISKQNFKQIQRIIISEVEQIDKDRKGLINIKQIQQKISLKIPQGFLVADHIAHRIINKIINNIL